MGSIREEEGRGRDGTGGEGSGGQRESRPDSLSTEDLHPKKREDENEERQEQQEAGDGAHAVQ